MTIYVITPAPDEKVTTVWTVDRETGKWISWSRHERRWLESAGGHYYTWGELLDLGPVTDINPKLSEFTKALQESGERDEASAYKIALALWDRGYRAVVKDTTPDDPAAEPC